MTDTPLLLGHRGSRANTRIPENTLASFDLALKHGCQGFEFDVRRTNCGKAVICHDPRYRGVNIAKAKYERLNLPLLQEVLAAYHKRAFLDIELKIPGLESEVLLALKKNPPQHGHVVSSFLPGVLAELSLRSSNIPLGFICDKKNHLPRWRELPAQFVIPHHSLITSALVEELHKAGKTVITWTVNDKATMRRLAKWEVDGIISDQTQKLVQTLS
jgi:glycerophosphoryl diester phosphodiesterase